MIKLASLLQEVGEASATPVPFERTQYYDSPSSPRTVSKYKFTIEDKEGRTEKYVLTIKDYTKSGDAMRVEFDTEHEGEAEEDRFPKDTNQNQPYKVMATVVTILKQYVEENPETQTIEYEPIKTDPKKDKSGSRREKLYKAYVNKQLPGWSYTDEEDTIVLRRPKKELAE
jgi:hypothetical protein